MNVNDNISRAVATVAMVVILLFAILCPMCHNSAYSLNTLSTFLYLK